MSGPTSRRRERPERVFPVLLSLGSNVEPRENLPRAVALLARRFPVRAVSRVWETEPVGAPGTPPFLNAAVLIETALAPRALKHEVLRPLEARLGRVRGGDPNAPRTVDIDIALYDELVLEAPGDRLALPDPAILTRAHVALPLAEVAPGLRHPLTGETLAAIARRFAGAPGVRVCPEVTLDGPARAGEEPGRPRPAKQG